MDNLYNLLGRDRINWQNCKEALTEQGQNMAGIATDDYAGKIRNLQLVDGFEQTPELRNFPDIRSELTDSTFKMLVLRNGTGAIGVAVTLPSGKSGSINWGDATTINLTASGAAVNYYHTWESWQTSTDGFEEYNIVTITGDVTAISAIASTVTAPRYWHTVVWVAAKSTNLKTFALGNSSNIYAIGLRRIDIDAPNCVLGSTALNSAANLRVLQFSGTFGTANVYQQLRQTAIDTITYTNTTAAVLDDLFTDSRGRVITVYARTTGSVSMISMCYGALTLTKLSINVAWGSMLQMVYSCRCLRELDMTDCPVNGITDFTGNTNLYSLQKLLFPSYIDTDSIRKPKAFAPGITNMGAIDITNSGLDRKALIEMFYSLPINATAVNCKITGSIGAMDLTNEEIAIAANKNWTVIR